VGDELLWSHLEPEMITAAEAGSIVKQSLSAMYQEGRFLGGFEHDTGPHSPARSGSRVRVLSFTSSFITVD
jgi:hypothetical protein